jgi:hypothetical protein
MNQKNGKAYGPGLYFGDDSIASGYASGGVKPLKAKFNVKKLLTDEKLSAYQDAAYNHNSLFSYMKMKEINNFDDAMSYCITKEKKVMKEYLEKIGKNNFNKYSKLFDDLENAPYGGAFKEKLLNDLITQDGYDHYIASYKVSTKLVNGKPVGVKTPNVIVVFDDKKVVLIN